MASNGQDEGDKIVRSVSSELGNLPFLIVLKINIFGEFPIVTFNEVFLYSFFKRKFICDLKKIKIKGFLIFFNRKIPWSRDRD